MPYKDKEVERAYQKKRDRRAYDRARYHNNEKRREYARAAAKASRARLVLRTTPEQRTELTRHRPCRSQLARRNEHLKARYRLTLEQWNMLFESQGRCCAICRSPDPGWKRGWHTDHDHETNKIRGILCQLCNRTLGHAKDDVDWFLAFVVYLRKPSSSAVKHQPFHKFPDGDIKHQDHNDEYPQAS